MVFERLSVKITADTLSARTGISRVREGLEDLGFEASQTTGDISGMNTSLKDTHVSGLLAASGLVETAMAARRAEESVEDLDDEAEDANRSLAVLGMQSRRTAIGLHTLNTRTTGLLLPLTNLIAAIVPLIAVLGGMTTAAFGLAGALGAVLTSGALAYSQQLTGQYQRELNRVQDRIQAYERLEERVGTLTDAQQNQLRALEEREQQLDDTNTAFGALSLKIKDALSPVKDIIAAFGQQFAPLIEDAIEALPLLTARIAAALGPMDEFRGFIRQLGETGMTAIPFLVETFTDFARLALPVVEDLFSFLDDQGPGIFRAMGHAIVEIGPELSGLLDSFLRFTEASFRYGLAVNNVLLPAFKTLFDIFADLFSTLADLEPRTRRFVVALTSVAGVVPIISAALGLLTTVMSGTAIAVGSLAAAWAVNMFGMRDITERVMSDITQMIARESSAWAGIFGRNMESQMTMWERFEVHVAAGLDFLTTLFLMLVDTVSTVRQVVGDFMSDIVRSLDLIGEGKIQQAERLIRGSVTSSVRERGAALGERWISRWEGMLQRMTERNVAMRTGDTSMLPGSREATTERMPEWLRELIDGTRSDEYQKSVQEWLSKISDNTSTTAAMNSRVSSMLEGSAVTQGPCNLRDHLLAPYEKTPQTFQAMAGSLADTRAAQEQARTPMQAASQFGLDPKMFWQEAKRAMSEASTQQGSMDARQNLQVVLQADGKRLAETNAELDEIYNEPTVVD